MAKTFISLMMETRLMKIPAYVLIYVGSVPLKGVAFRTLHLAVEQKGIN